MSRTKTKNDTTVTTKPGNTIMPNPKNPSPAEETEWSEHDEIHSEGFQFANTNGRLI
jgi:hypothetical protein